MTLRQVPDETDTKAADSAQAVIRLAVRESWRHAALIYLYLAMCGARSDDPRIQSSVRQVIKLIDDIRPDNSYTTFFFPSISFRGNMRAKGTTSALYHVIVSGTHSPQLGPPSSDRVCKSLGPPMARRCD
ncbi:hypothetical protein RSOLAG22IIIB_13242 [Rhizoctonia solani]|uniref:Uncharacterized protein n=1 Tax=Rhizoctonia solani TaxID=456999 RepID=A0A0K6FLU1_9AGAM|nr:hypothetical protein RSOLAG22IIIB_13242 [Rhizoctonia solani]